MMRWPRLTLVILAVLALAACGQREPVRIGFLAELTGRTADLAEAARNGVALAVDQFREAGALQGRGIELLVRDSGPDSESTRKATEELINSHLDVIIGGTTSGMVENVLPVIEKAQVLFVSPTASAIEFYGKDDMLFRINTTTRENGYNYAAHYFQKGIRRISVAVNANNRAFSESWLKEFRTAYETLGGAILVVPCSTPGPPTTPT